MIRAAPPVCAAFPARAAPLAAAAILVTAIAAGPAMDGRSGQVIIRNNSFSALEISVLVADEESIIGSAPPEFSNTLYFPVPGAASTLRFRARLPGTREVLHESDPVDVRAGIRVQWTLPENTIKALLRSAAAAPLRQPPAEVRAGSQG